MTETLYDQAMEMYQQQDFNKLRAFKKAKKKSWAALGINAEMEARIKLDPVLGTVSGRLTSNSSNIMEIARGTAKTENQKKMLEAQWEKRRKRLELPANLSNIRYTPREIHVLKSQSSHNTIAHMAQVREQEKFRADPRFPIFQMTQRAKRYADIFKGRPYLPIFGGPGAPA